jgi:hypothetical protein
MKIILTITFLSLCLFLVSCRTRVDHSMKGEFRYYNRTSNTIDVSLKGGIIKAFDAYTIASGDSFVLFTSDIGPEVVDPKDYRPGILADTTTIMFNDTLCYSEYDKAGNILHNIDRYTYVKKGNNYYIFFFSIDSNLFKLAKSCR